MAQNILQTPISALIPPSHRPIICVNSLDSLESTLQALVTNQIHSVPVFDTTKNEFVAFIDLIDFAVHLAHTYIENEIIEGSVDRMLQEEKHYVTLQIANESHRNPWLTIPVTANLGDAIEKMTQHNAHRIAVMEAQNLKYVLTQTDIVEFFQQRALPELRKKTLHELGIGFKEVVTVPSSEKVWKAFILMNSKGVSGIGVVDAKGNLVSHIGSADLKGIDFNTQIMKNLKMSISDFKNQLSLVAVPATSTLGDVIDTLTTTKMHRVYIVDKDHTTAKGVVSQSNVIQAVYDTYK